MNPERGAKISFWLGYAGIMYAILFGRWNPHSSQFFGTVAATVVGVILVARSFVYFYKERKKHREKK